ncbi:RDD family protein [Methanopyrus sp. KOL6]|uniref:RDD family protein n=1 Tax=Methanopyrus sp. KOL6 TaxID=1937004 RepID=UPI000B4B4A6F|nr:RDD family protein [Methanopyrus sp. KOL6]
MNPAPFELRFGAYAIDCVITAVISLLICLALACLVTPVKFLSTWSLTSWIYWTIFEGTYGESPGKRVFELKVVNEEGEAVSFPEAAIRNVSKALPVVCYVDGALVLLTESRQRMFDLLAGTLVVTSG